ncbi:EGF-like domain-containing protein [Trichonephila clavipes]|uniref:EGF-like domain-containing protein n=1 Tax=Trichonephila clavipes TaxID=2585209 RepID=A0A8X6VHV0_TRICX|nr:EGF-like domain-containing protein [Trichonephila clavipes]
MKHMAANSAGTTHAKSGLPTWRVILNVGIVAIVALGILAEMVVLANLETIKKLVIAQDLTGESPCDPNPCKNDGICVIEDEKTKCLCLEPFGGEYCENEKETTTQNIRTSTLMTTPPMLTTPSIKCECGEKSSGCFVDANGIKRCICLPGYAEIKEICSDCYCGMQSLSCRFNSTGDKICQCKPGYGQKNRICVEMCASDSDCLNGGLCKRFEKSSFCECRTHFIGDKCETSTVCDELRERCKAIGALCTQRYGKAACECPPHKTYVLQTGFCEGKTI